VEPGGVRAVVRDGVGISRRTGASAAEAGALYDAEWIPAGTGFHLRVEIEHGAPELAEQVLAVALSEWKAGRGRIGGGAARGGGAFKLDQEAFRHAVLASPAGLMAFLRAETPEDRGAVVTGWLERRVAEIRPGLGAEGGAAAKDLPAGAVGSFASFSFDLAFDGPLMVNDPAAALAHAVSFAPVFAGSDWERPVLPGSSVRGVLRAQAERIARTVSSRAAGNLAGFASACAACDPFCKSGDDALRSCADLADVHERETGEDLTLDNEEKSRCLGCALFGSTRQGSRLWIADAELSGEARFRLRDFVAIDRFTGGALEGAKFDALPLYSPTFRVEMLLWEPAKWELGALALALRDLHDGLATLGAHGSRGFGRAEVRGVSLRIGRVGGRGPKLPERAQPEPSGVFLVDGWDGGDAGALARLAGERGWAGELIAECVQVRRAVDAASVRDSYFGVTTEEGYRMEDLYPLTVDLAGLEVAHGA
jgi:CRISPR/Cas system CSM-associated protein Csm3 (group 7 of RAMP superfamily)